MTQSGKHPLEKSVEIPDAADAGLWFIGRIQTPWTKRRECPRQGDPVSGLICEIRVDARWAEALQGVAGKERLQILYWMHDARRDLVLQKPVSRDDATGTFSLRSPVRPNPIASSVVKLEKVEGTSLFVRGLDCLDGTPLLDIKPVPRGHANP